MRLPACCNLFLQLLLLTNAYVNPPTGPEDCGLGELWEEGSSCPKTCKDIREVLDDLHDPPENPVVKPCDEKKVYGCFCRWNLLRNSSGSCVHRKDCPFSSANCKSNEMWTRDSTACPRTCEWEEIIAHLWVTQPAKCILDKFEYCFCNGWRLYRDMDGDGDCVTLDKCTHLVCKENEVLAHGFNCPPTCANLDPRGPCFMHRGRKCFCQDGFVRNSAGFCVEPEDCPQ